MEAIKNLSSAARIGGISGVAVLGGIGSGLLIWWAEDSVKNEIQDKPWLLPLVGGVAGAAVAGFMAGNRVF